VAQESGTARPSFVASQLEALAHEGAATQDDLDDIKGTSSVLYIGVMNVQSRLLLSTDIYP